MICNQIILIYNFFPADKCGTGVGPEMYRVIPGKTWKNT